MKKLCVFAFLLVASALAAASPWDSWRSGYTTYEQGEKLSELGNYTEALKRFRASKQHYLSVRRARPDWNQRVIAARIADCDKQISRIEALLYPKKRPASPQKQQPPGAAVGKNSQPVAATTPAAVEPRNIDTYGGSDDTPALAAQKAEYEQKLAALRRQLAAAESQNRTLQQQLVKQRNFEREISNLVHDRKVALEKQALLEARLKQLETDMAKPDTRIEELQTQLVETKMTLARENKKRQEIEAELEKVKKQAYEHQLARSAAEKLLARSESEKRQFAADAARVAESEKNAVQRANELAARLESAGKQIEELTASIGTQQSASADATLAITALKQNIAAKDEAIAALQKELKQLNQIIAERNALIMEEQKNSSELKKDLMIAVAERKKLQENIAELQKSSARLADDVKQLSESNRKLSARLATRDSEDFRNAAAAQETCRRLEKDLLVLQTQLVELRSISENKNRQISELQRQLKSSASELALARTELKQSNEKLAENSKAAGEIAALQQKLATLQRNFDALNAENQENRALVAAAKPKEAELARIKLRLLELERLKNALHKEQQLTGELNSERRRMEIELKELRKNSTELASLRRRSAEFDAAARELSQLKVLLKRYEGVANRERELAALKLTHAALQSSFEEQKALLLRSQAEYKRAAAEISKLKADQAAAQRLQTRIAELNTMLTAQSGELDKLNAKIKRLESGASDKFAAEHKREIAELQRVIAQIGPLNDALNKLRSEKKVLAQQLADSAASLRRTISALQESLKLKDGEIGRLQKLNAELIAIQRNSVNNLQNESFSARITALEQENSSITKLNVELAAERDRLVAEINQLRSGAIYPGGNADTALSGESAAELASAGAIAEQRGSYALAVWNYRQAILKDPEFITAHLKLGKLLFARKDYKAAIPHLSTARNAFPNDVALALKTGFALAYSDRCGNAGAIVEQLLKEHAENYQLQHLAALVQADAGRSAQAENHLLTAIRLSPKQPELYVALARLLSANGDARSAEAVTAYETARNLGSAPVPDLEKALGKHLDRKRDMIRFLSGAAGEAEVNRDWQSAIWYYKKLMELDSKKYAPFLAFAQLQSGNPAAARETLQFSSVSRLGMAVLVLVELKLNSPQNALRAAQQLGDVTLPAQWVGFKLELERLRKQPSPPVALRLLLSHFPAQ